MSDPATTADELSQLLLPFYKGDKGDTGASTAEAQEAATAAAASATAAQTAADTATSAVAGLATYSGAESVGYRYASGANTLTVGSKIRNATPVDPRDYGGDDSGTTSSSTAIYKALQTGRPVVGLTGKWRLSTAVVWDANESIDLSADSGTTNQLILNNVYKDAGAFTGISIRNARRPDVRLFFSGGGGSSLTDIGVDWYNVEAMKMWLSGFNFQGLLANYDGTNGKWVENMAMHIIARRCYKAFNFAGPSAGNTGTGKIDSIWDVLPYYGSNFVNLSDLTVEHYENTVLADTFSATTSLGIVSCTSSHFGKVALGNAAPTLMNMNGCTNIDFDNLYLLGGDDNTDNSSTVVGLDVKNNALIKIDNLTCSSCGIGVTKGNSSNLEIGKFNGLQNGVDIQIKGAGGSIAVDLNIDEYFSQQSYGESIIVDSSVTGLSGRITIDSGRIRTGNVGGASTGAIMLSPASLTSGAAMIRIADLDVDVEPGATAHPYSVKCYYRGNFTGERNRFKSTVAVQDSFGSVSGFDGRGFVMPNPAQSFSTWTENDFSVALQIWVPFRFETSAVAGEYATLQLKSPNGTVHDLVDTQYNAGTLTVAKYFTLKAIVPPGWSWQFTTSSSTHVTFQGTPRSVSL